MSDEMSVASKEKLVSDLKVVVSDTEELLRSTAGVAGEKAGELRERIAIRLRDAKERLADADAALRDKTNVDSISATGQRCWGERRKSQLKAATCISARLIPYATKSQPPTAYSGRTNLSTTSVRQAR